MRRHPARYLDAGVETELPKRTLPAGLRTGEAGADDECGRCAFPFDAGDQVVTDECDAGAVFCGAQCALRSREARRRGLDPFAGRERPICRYCGDPIEPGGALDTSDAHAPCIPRGVGDSDAFCDACRQHVPVVYNDGPHARCEYCERYTRALPR